MSEQCGRCERGREACGYCHDIATEDWEAICDCGLYDFDVHLLDCEARAGFRWIVALSEEEAALRVA